MKYRVISFVVLGLMAGLGLPAAAVACPNPDAPATTVLRETGVGLRRGRMVRVLVSGIAPLSDCPQAERARDSSASFPISPTLRLDLSGMIGLGVELRPEMACAREMVVMTRDGTWYHRGPGLTGGLPPMVISQVGSGSLLVWIGTGANESCRMRLDVLTITR